MAEPAEKLSVTITPAMAARIRAQVDAGHYGSASEVIRDALRLWEKRQQELDLLRAREGVDRRSAPARAAEGRFRRNPCTRRGIQSQERR